MTDITPPKSAISYRRNDVLNAMVTKLQGVQAGSEYIFEYRFVTRDPLGADNIGKLQYGEIAVGVYDVNEEKQRFFSGTNATLTVIVEFYYKPKMGDTKSEILNVILAEVTKALMLDQTLSGTSLRLEDISNNLDIDGIYDKIVNGSITFHVMYRHGTYDPTKAIC